MCSWSSRTCFGGGGTGGCGELCHVEGDHGGRESFVRRGVVMSLVVLGMIIMYRGNRWREVVLCQVMEVCGQLGNSGCDGFVSVKLSCTESTWGGS